LIATQLPLESGEKIMTLGQLREQRGKQNTSLEIAQNSLRKGLDPILVAEITGIDLQIVKEMVVVETQHEEV
jgi:predicted transposase YdaD